MTHTGGIGKISVDYLHRGMDMKKTISVTLVLITLLVCLVGCGSGGDTADTTASAEVTTEATTEETTALPTTTAAPTTAEPTTLSDEIYVYESAGQAPLYRSDNIFNVLLIGTDSKTNYGRSDTMMILSIDNTHRKIKMTSVLRDTYVTIPGNGSNKLNAAYAYGGADLCVNTIEYNFGIGIDAYAIVNFKTFCDLINAIGGVDVEVTADEIAYINAQIAQNGQSNYIPSGTSAGMVHLTGYQSLWHVRNRGGTVNGIYFYGTDWDRVDRQQRMFAGIINSLSSISFDEVSTIACTVLPYITTNMSSGDIAAHIANASTYLSYSIERMSVPSGSHWYNVYYDHAGSALGINDWDALRREMATFIYENIE